jgi:hypothetical protein
MSTLEKQIEEIKSLDYNNILNRKFDALIFDGKSKYNNITGILKKNIYKRDNKFSIIFERIGNLYDLNNSLNLLNKNKSYYVLPFHLDMKPLVKKIINTSQLNQLVKKYSIHRTTNLYEFIKDVNDNFNLISIYINIDLYIEISKIPEKILYNNSELLSFKEKIDIIIKEKKNDPLKHNFIKFLNTETFDKINNQQDEELQDTLDHFSRNFENSIKMTLVVAGIRNGIKRMKLLKILSTL